jgi:hypothetical protein
MKLVGIDEEPMNLRDRVVVALQSKLSLSRPAGYDPAYVAVVSLDDLADAVLEVIQPAPEQLLVWLRQLRRGLQKMRPNERVSLNYLGTENETKVDAELHAIIAEAMPLGEE